MASWGYTSSNGPDKWVKDFPIAKGARQSPIDIVTSAAQYDADLGNEPLKTDYNLEENLCLKNNGHSIMCQIKKQSELSGGPLTGKYRLEQFHLHWGSKDNKGSEHTIDGKSYSAELHLVHWNTKYGGFAEAVDKPDGLAVLGIMIKPGSENQTFNAITNNIENLEKSGSEFTVPVTFDPTLLLPDNTSKYWTYEGSLTTPPLLESVQWIVFKEPVEYSSGQLNKLRSLVDSDQQKMQDNFRSPLPVGNRQVRSSVP